MISYLFILLMVSLVSACDSEQDGFIESEKIPSEQKRGYALILDNGDVSEVDSATFYNIGKSMTRASSLDFLSPIVKRAPSLVQMRATGYTKKSTIIKATKCAYSSDSPILLGANLPAGIYFTECIKVTKQLSSYNAGDFILPVPATPDDKITGLVDAGLFSTTLGWTSDEPKESGDKMFNGITYIIHFLYDLSGKSIDRYYPCKPENLIWNYTSASFDNL